MARRVIDHRHGVASNKCDHPDCREAFARYRKHWAYRSEKGERVLVDAEPARLHIATLEGSDWTHGAIAAVANLSLSTVDAIAAGQAKVKADTAAAILAVDPSSTPDRPGRRGRDVLVPALGTRRRIRALQYMGWSASALAAHSGRTVKVVKRRRDQPGRWVWRSTHEWVAQMYRELSHKRGPSAYAANTARSRGYVGPAHWDDIDHDPEPEPDQEETAA